MAAEIADVSPDILCMQEVNNVDSFASLLPEYAMIWVPKLLSPAVSAGATPDGIAIFVRRTRFAILDVETMYYRDDGLAAARDAAAVAVAAGGGAGAAPAGAGATRVRPLGNQAGIVLALSEVGSRRPLIVATTHLKAKGGPANDALRSRQITQLLAAVRAVRSRLASALGLAGEHAIPVVVTGDMNSDPRKGVFAAAVDDPSLAMHSVYNEHTTAHAFGGAAAAGAAACSFAGLPPHPPAEVYASGEPAFTTWKYRGAEEGATAAAGAAPSEKRHTIDYIFVSGLERSSSAGSGSSSDDSAATAGAVGGVATAGKGTGAGPLLKLTAVRNLLTAAEIGPGALPSARFPSDHLSLAATFEWA